MEARSRAPRHLGKFSSMVIPHGPDFNEADVSDKPAYIQALPALTAADVKNLDNERRRARETLLSVDEAVGGVVQALQDTNRLANTLIVFASDQGLNRGEHRLVNKGAPYEGIINIPLVMRFDAVGSTARTESRLASNIDFAPTFAALAGTSMPGVDGRNLLPLLTGEQVPWRSNVLTEYVKDDSSTPSYCAIRTTTEEYVALRDGRAGALRPRPRPVRARQPRPRPGKRLRGVEAGERRGRESAASRPGRRPPPWGPPARFVPVAPYRLMDTRAPGPFGIEKPYAGQTLSVGVVGQGTPVTPPDAIAVAMNVTVTQAEGTGFLTVFPTGDAVPNASLQNFVAGTTAPNFTRRADRGAGEGVVLRPGRIHAPHHRRHRLLRARHLRHRGARSSRLLRPASSTPASASARPRCDLARAPRSPCKCSAGAVCRPRASRP